SKALAGTRRYGGGSVRKPSHARSSSARGFASAAKARATELVAWPGRCRDRQKQLSAAVARHEYGCRPTHRLLPRASYLWLHHPAAVRKAFRDENKTSIT